MTTVRTLTIGLVYTLFSYEPGDAAESGVDVSLQQRSRSACWACWLEQI